MISRDTIARFDEKGAALEICRIVEEPDGSAPSLCTIVHLGLPPRAPEAFIRYSSCIRESVPAYSDAPSFVIEGRPPKHPPFHSSPKDGLVVVVIAIGTHSTFITTHITIVTRLRSFIALTATMPPGVTYIPWETWGPRITACFELPFSCWSDALIGDRLATISGGTFSLFDFNSTRIWDAIRRGGNPPRHGMHLTTVKYKSVIPRGRLLKEDIVGELPYISVIKPAFVDWGFLTKYEEGLAGLSWLGGSLVSPTRNSPTLIIIKADEQDLLHIEVRTTE